jgi:uncharacterized protein
MNCIIVHGSDQNDLEAIKKGIPPQNKRHWIPWIKNALEGKGIKTDAPLMPKNWAPSYGEWKEVFEKLDVNENTVLVGHSVGAGFLVRWLGESEKKVKKLILISPAILHSGYFGWLKSIINFKINKGIPTFVGRIIIFSSDNDMEGIKEAVEIYSKELNVKPIELKNKGHFLIQEMGTEEFPELLDEIIK